MSKTLSAIIKLLDMIVSILIYQSFLNESQRKDLKIALWEVKMAKKEEDGNASQNG